MQADDETNVTEIELLPDGRICLFGASREVLTVLDELLDGRNEELHQRLQIIHGDQSELKKTIDSVETSIQ
jgi:hypothetical protein